MNAARSAGAALLAIPIGESRALRRDAVDVRSAVTHDAAVIATRVKPPDVVTHDDEDVWFFRLRECRAVKKCAEREAEQQSNEFCSHDGQAAIG